MPISPCLKPNSTESEKRFSSQIEIEIEVAVSNPSGEENSFADSISIELPAKYRVNLAMIGSDTAASDVDGDGKSSSGDEVTFTLTVNNTGSIDLTSVEVQTGAGLEGLVCQQFIPSAVGEF